VSSSDHTHEEFGAARAQRGPASGLAAGIAENPPARLATYIAAVKKEIAFHDWALDLWLTPDERRWYMRKRDEAVQSLRTARATLRGLSS
jgi:hypothetical protein